MKEEYYFNYPNEPIGGDNPYYRCCSCKRSDPEINGKLDGHYKHCEWARVKRMEIELEELKKKNKS